MIQESVDLNSVYRDGNGALRFSAERKRNLRLVRDIARLLILDRRIHLNLGNRKGKTVANIGRYRVEDCGWNDLLD